MNKEDLFNAIGQVDEKLLVDSQTQGHHAVSTAKKRRFLAFAACFCMVIVGVFAFFASDYDFSSESAFDQLASTQAAAQAALQETTGNTTVTDFSNSSDDIIVTEPFEDTNTTTSAPYELIDSYSTSKIEYIGTPFTQEHIDMICETYDLYGTNGEKILLEDCYYMLEISSDSNVINQNFLYYTIYNGDEATGQIIFYEDGNYSMVSFDSSTYFFINDMLKETQGQTVYSIIILENNIQAYISEDGSFYCSYDLTSLFDDESANYVALFGCEENIFK